MDQVLPTGETNVADLIFLDSGEIDINQCTPEEYLAWVRYQAEFQCDAVVRVQVNSNQYANRQTAYMPKIEEILSCNDDLIPSTAWENETLHSFSELRLYLERLSGNMKSRERKLFVPAMKNEKGWFHFCLGPEEIGYDKTEDDDGSEVSYHNDDCDDIDDLMVLKQFNVTQDELPATHRSMGQSNALKRKRAMLSEFKLDVEYVSKCPPIGEGLDTEVSTPYNEMEVDERGSDNGGGDIDDEVEEDHQGVSVEDINLVTCVDPTTSLLLQFDQVLTQKLLKYHTDWLDNGCILSLKKSKWIYALLARLQKPLCLDTNALIRSLFRICCRIRHRVSEVLYPLQRGSQDASINNGDISNPGSSARNSSYLTSDDHIAALNVIIVLCGKYFEQEERRDVCATSGSSTLAAIGEVGIVHNNINPSNSDVEEGEICDEENCDY